MKKRELLKELSNRTGFKMNECEVFYTNLIQLIYEKLKIDSVIKLYRFCTIKKTSYKDRVFYNPLTKQKEVSKERVYCGMNINKELKGKLKNE